MRALCHQAATQQALRRVGARCFTSSVPSRVKIYEVGARDGLQNEPAVLSPQARAEFVNRLSQTGVAAVEPAAFVHPKLVPQMAGAADLMRAITPKPGIAYPVLVPNLKGFKDAVEAGASAVAVMTAASETFSRNNVNAGVHEALDRALEVAAEAARLGLPCRGYISTCLGCPFEGTDVPPETVAHIAEALYKGGCYEVVISDTIGTGTAGSMAAVLSHVLPVVPVEHIAVHCHDTYGQALANILTALQHGVATIDSSVAGLGGCPFAGPGAAGNVATEDVVYMLDGLGIETGVDFDAVVRCGESVVAQLGRPNASKAAVASLKRGMPMRCVSRAREAPSPS